MPPGVLEAIKSLKGPRVPSPNRCDTSSREPSPAPSSSTSTHATVDTPLTPDTNIPRNVVSQALVKRVRKFRVSPLSWRNISPREASPTPTRQTSSPASSGSTPIHPTPPAPVPLRNMAFEKAVAVVLQKHIDRLSDGDKEAFKSASAVDVMEELKKAQDGTSRISDSLTHVQKVLECINRLMEPLKIFIQHSPGISALVVGGFKCVLMLGLGYTEFFGNFTAMMDRIAGHLSYLSKYASAAFEGSVEIQEAMVAVFCDLLDFYVKVRGLFTNQKGKQSYVQGFRLFLKVVWEPVEREFQSIEACFINHTNIIVRLASVEHQIFFKEMMQEQQILFKEQIQNIQREKRRVILKWLSKDDFEETHNRHYDERCNGTGQWLLRDSRLIGWQDGAQSSLLWCHGAPGSGKTVLASLVVEHLSKLYQLSSNTGVTFVYCNYKEPRTSATYIRLAIKQLCRRMPILPPRLEEVYERHYPNHSQPNSEELQAIFLATAEYFDSMFLVLDALDECTQDHRAELCKFFSNIIELSATSRTVESHVGNAQSTSTIVKLFVTSRKEPDIERVFRQKSFQTMEIEAEKVDHDIAIYVTAQIEQRIKDEQLILRNPLLKHKIFTTLTTKSGGMFLWAKFQLDEICELSQISDNEIEKALGGLPEDLVATYERIIDSIRKKHRALYNLARRVLTCVTYSFSPIPVSLLRYAVSVEDGGESFEALEYSIPTDTAIVDACANLISIDRNTEQPVVRFVHFSVQEFLLSHQSSIETFGLQLELAHREIARMFITLLKILYFHPVEGDVGKRVTWNLIQHLDILHEWQYHLITGDMSSLSVDNHLMTLVSLFFQQGPPIPLTGGYFFIPAFLGILCFSTSALSLIFNLPGVHQHYQPQEVDRKTLAYDRFRDIYCRYQIGAPCDDGFFSVNLNPAVIFDDRFAMHYAVIHLDSIPVVKRLYIHGYPIDCSYQTVRDPVSNFQCTADSELIQYFNFWSEMPKKYQRSPVHSARSEVMAKVLLDCGASTDPRFVGSMLYDPLSRFAMHGYTNLIKPVSDRVTYHHARRHSEALLASLIFRQTKVIQLLIDSGVDIKIGSFGNTLQAAVYYGNAECIQPLLARGTDVNAVGGEYGTALQAASAGSAYLKNLDCVQVLLDKGADVNTQGGHYGTALQAAARSYPAEPGTCRVMQLLLDKGADVNAVCGLFGTALQAAASRGSFERVQLLLAKGADVNVVGGFYGTALQAAASVTGPHEDLECIQLLLDWGADVNALGGKFGTALQAAVDIQYMERIPLLLEKGADVNAVGGAYGTALQAAAKRGNSECIQLLLDKGADVNIVSGEFGTALQAAAVKGSSQCIQLLLDRGADIHALGGKYGTALQAAAHKGNFECIELLLERGAHVNILSGEFGTALHAAACTGKYRSIQLLLDRGADVNTLGGEYSTVLQAALHATTTPGSSFTGGFFRFKLDKGTKTNTLGGEYDTALSDMGYINELMYQHLDRGAGVDTLVWGHDTGWQAALNPYSRFMDIYRCILHLLNNGANIHAVGGEYGTALHAAAYGGSSSFVGQLLGAGADVHGVAGRYGTALQAAAAAAAPNRRYTELWILKLGCVYTLLNAGSDVNAQGGEYGTALQAAAYACRLEVVELLLDSGASVNARGGKYGTALQAAIASIQENDSYLHFRASKMIDHPPQAIIEILLDHGADITVHVPDSQYGDALTAAKHVLKDDPETLDWLMEFLESWSAE